MRVSVVINTINRREWLERALLALREQTVSDFEVIVVNGPSTDDTADLLRAFRRSIRRADCPVASLGRSRNIGIAMAAGEVVAFIDDDGIPEPGWLAGLLGPYGDPAVAGVGGPVFDLHLGQPVWRLCTCTRLGVAVPEATGPLSDYTAPDADPFAYMPGCNMSFRREALVGVGGFNPRLIYNYDDAEVCARLIDSGRRFELLADVLVTHARAPSSARDAELTTLDPFPALYCRAIFMAQCGGRSTPRESVAAEIEAVAEAARVQAHGDLALAAEPGDLQQHLSRIDSALRAGLADGARPRGSADLGRARPWRFRRFR